MVFKEVGNNAWTYENEGDSVEGVLIKVEKNVGAWGSNLYTLEKDAKIIEVWGSTILDSRMDEVKLGNLIKITYKGLGMKKGNKNPPKIFKVEVDVPEETHETIIKES